jgi:hypothetical protein
MMSRKLFTLDDETLARLSALTNPAQTVTPYASESEAIRAAVDLLHTRTFCPASDVPDAVLEKIERYCALALSAARDEISRRDVD